MRFFVGFLWLATFLAIYTAVVSIMYIVWNIIWMEDSLEKAKKYGWMGYSAIPFLAIGAWSLKTNGMRMHALLLPGIVGVGLMSWYMGIVIGFDGVTRTPVPAFIGAVGLFYIPWYS